VVKIAVFKYIAVIVLLVSLALSCTKAPASRRTELSGTVVHAGASRPEPGVKVQAVYFYKEPFGFFSPVQTIVIDSALTDVSGNYYMQFNMDVNVDSVAVQCVGKQISTRAKFVPGKINQQINLMASDNLPVVAFVVHVINNHYPPLIIDRPQGDSVILSAAVTSDTIIYNQYFNNYTFPIGTSTFSSYFSAHYIKAGIKQSNAYSFPGLPFADTVYTNTVVDASIFQP
jgi:hypothetical protein